MPTVTITLHKPHQAQAQIKREARRFNVVDCGRRFGKTLFGTDLLIDPVLHGHPVAWFAPSYKYLIEVWDEVASMLAPVTTEINKTDKRLKTIGGGSVRMWTLQDKDAGRGDAYRRAVIDEAAMVPDLLNIWDNAIRPTLSDYQGDAWFFSTPKGHNGFWQLWQRGQDDAYPDWLSWQFPTSANPYIAPTEIEAARKSLPERVFAQEYLAQFMDDAGGVFRKVMKAAVLDPLDGPIDGHGYVFGVDWGKSNDWTVISVWDSAEQKMVYQDRFNQIDYHFQRERLGALNQQFHPRVIQAESNAMGEPIIDELRRDGLPVRAFNTTNATKAAIIEQLALGFEQESIQIVNDPVLIGELQAYEIGRTPSGMVRYSAPDGMHDDCVMAAAIGYDACAKHSSGSPFGFW